MSQGIVKSQSAPPRLHFRISPEPSHLLRARERLRDYLNQYCAEHRVIDQILLCVEEAATNAIRHSASGEDMEISVRFEAGDLVAEVRDQGHGFDVAVFDPEVLPDVMSDHGRGLFLISKLSDEMQLCCDGGLEVRMVKRAVIPRESVDLEGGFGDIQTATDLIHRDLRLRALLEEIDEGFFALDWECRYVHANATGLQMAGKPLKEILGHAPWEVFPALRGSQLEKRYRQAMELGRPSVLEHRSVVTGDWLEVRIYPTPAGVSAYYREINDRKRADLERETTVGFLRLINESDSLVALAQAATAFFQQQSGCEAVGIRLRDGEDYPYFETRGFPAKFVELENSLCARDHEGELCRDSAGHPIMECMCGNVICGRFDAAQEFFSERGSFWSSHTTTLLATSSEQDRQARTRNRCNGEAYESVALIALRVGEQRIGLLQLNDRHIGRFAPEDIALWERLADQLAVAIAKLRLEEELRESQEHYRTLFDTMLEGFCVIEVIFDDTDKPIDYRFLEVNPVFEERTGLHDAQGKLMRDLAPDHEQHWFDIYGKVALTGEPARFMAPAEALGRYYDVSAFRVGDPQGRQVAILFDDISKRHRAQLEGQRLLEESRTQAEMLQAQTEELQTQGEELQTQSEELQVQNEELLSQRDSIVRESELRAGLNAIAELLHSTLEPDEVVKRTLHEAARTLALDAAAIELREGDDWPVRYAEGLPTDDLGRPLLGEPVIARYVILTGEALVADAAADHATVGPFAIAQGIRSIMAIPLVAREQMVGVLLLIERRVTRHFEPAEVDFARRLGSTVGLALENARLLKRETEAARLAASLNEINGLINSTLDAKEIMQSVVEHAVAAVGADSAMVALRHGDDWVAEYGYPAVPGVIHESVRTDEAPFMIAAATQRRPIAIDDCESDSRCLPEVQRRFGVRSVLCIPLIVREEVLGVIFFNHHEAAVAFTPEIVDFAAKLASAISAALANAQLYDAQRRIATTLQENFIHPLPEVAGLELGVVATTAYEPERVGGDFSDVFVVDDSHVVALIGDVAGKGVRAAGMTETVRSTVRALAAIDPSPAFILGKANELLLRFDPDEPHVTAFLAVLDPHTGHLSYASAGHPAPVHLGAFTCSPLEVSFGPPLGSFERPYASAHAMLTLDSYLVLYTDGVTEARRGVELLGEKRLVEAVCALRGLSAQRVAEGVRDAALAFGGKLRDDLQVVVLRLA